MLVTIFEIRFVNTKNKMWEALAFQPEEKSVEGCGEYWEMLKILNNIEKYWKILKLLDKDSVGWVAKPKSTLVLAARPEIWRKQL